MFLLLSYFKEIHVLIANSVDPDQMPGFVPFDVGLHCLFYGTPGINGLRERHKHGRCSAKGDNFCDFLFAYLHIRSILKRVYS